MIAHQCLTLHQVGVELASLKRNASHPPLDLEIIGNMEIYYFNFCIRLKK
ncbi:hypothetical protein Hanom_Chr06g00547241 [Helianthus anomalus]